MSYTIVSARFSNAEGTAALVKTREASFVMASEADNPDWWPDVLASKPKPYVPPVEPVLTPEDKLQAFLAANPDVIAAYG